MANIDTNNLEFVCEDAGDSKWFYREEDDKYLRVYPKTNQYTKISGKYLPDPEELLTKRVEVFKKTGKPVDLKSLECSEATRKLWDHRKKVI